MVRVYVPGRTMATTLYEPSQLAPKVPVDQSQVMSSTRETSGSLPGRGQGYATRHSVRGPNVSHDGLVGQFRLV
ncbi:hypothetical protein L3X38_013877 [Prunus dulcis]|uniref:Uncharacterized protein n=1 Tax=Prunus dulcis TaxID=3755 RepID=A0AAD4ZHY2_PRUDU|nr:hypothetical protein L3X38_013877 [Prunus dulcis]